MMSRMALKETELGSTKIPERAIVFICTYTLHRDAKYWKDAEVFSPERFLEGEFGGSVPYSYLPFGAGPHRCSGMRFAMDTIRIILALILREFQLAPSGQGEITPFPRVALQPEPGALVRVQRRADNLTKR